MWDREKAIDTLINDDIDSIMNSHYIDTLNYILESGFKGYRNFSDDELMNELLERDISPIFGDNDD